MMGFDCRQSGRVIGREYSWIRDRARKGKERQGNEVQGKERQDNEVQGKDILLNKNMKTLISILIIMNGIIKLYRGFYPIGIYKTVISIHSLYISIYSVKSNIGKGKIPFCFGNVI
jgi:hypothetical protein